MDRKTSRSALAIEGGAKLRQRPMPPRHLFGQAEKRAAMRLFDAAIESGIAFGYNGPEQRAYEAEFAAWLGGGHAVAVNSGTAAVFCALGALGIDVAREVVVPPITDPGGIMPVAMLNLVPVIADSAPGTFNVGPAQVEAVIGKRTAAIIVAHIAGEPVDIGPIAELARARNIPLIEDCAQAHGALYRGKPVGTFGTLAAFSTMSGKHHATGAQGGVVFTRDEELAWRVKRFSDRGKPFNLPAAGGNVTLGLNCNQNDLAAAIGRVQLRKLPAIVAKRRRLAADLKRRLKGLKAVALGRELPGTQGVYWFLRIAVDPSKLRVGKEEFAMAVEAEGLPVDKRYSRPHALMPWFANRQTYGQSGCPWSCPLYKGNPRRKFPCPNATRTADTNFVIYFHEGWGAAEIRDTAAALAKVERAYLK